MPELRSEPRDPITRKAQLQYEGAWVPVLIQDMSSRGFGIMSTRQFSVGQVSELRCEPFAGKEFQCQVEVRHSGESHMGVLIREMNETGRRLCMQLMQDYHSDRKMRNQ
ncbi:MAG: PilZ domain-containing protein [Betaproteobacteria bacterium]|nr:MAG: PilZ domain-containing protein [Betaproteobacteria bacterium]